MTDVIALEVKSYPIPKKIDRDQQHAMMEELAVSAFMHELSKGRELQASFHMYLPQGSHDAEGDGPRMGLVVTAWKDDAEKQIMLGGMADLMNYLGCRRFSFWCEVWYVQRNPGEEMIRPSDEPDRKEGLFLVTCDSEFARDLVTQYDVERSSDGGLPILTKIEGLEGIPDGGRFSRLIPRP